MNHDWVYFRIKPENMTFVTRIIEGCEYLGVVTALDGKKGIGFVRTVIDTKELTKEILMSLPFRVELLDVNQLKII
ncbi:MAG: DUF4911 domain-containing protein [Megasphaera sp.]|jgi:hypothetical protein|uniref:DUF4911 domain-containing protein n=1 Tax=Megasphaera paucivorans TaxID=349095 RepID=A0A1G9RFC1_9FIRM|nr:DUF4911 domain-containing protein [Megasphaera paucivorans]MCI1822292.1 DUF4911 domain-containing protein [Megasphaera sp.]MCI1822936.1 DUF4911 domain-containing protein [Megasphaera sp.]SDM22019.1 protein of unknown function [Megasphaera paucivorans]